MTSQFFHKSQKIVNNKGLFAFVRAIGRHSLRHVLMRHPNLLRSYVHLGRKIFKNRYTDADPIKLIYVDPSNISKTLHGVDPYYGTIQSINKGNTRVIRKTHFYESLENHFICGRRWENTEEFKRKKRKINSGEIVWGCDSLKKLKKRFEYLDSVYDDVNKNGYKSQRALLNDPTYENKDVFNKNNDSVHPFFNEIRVSIGVDGEILFHKQGKHRLIISDILGIDKIPVLVAVRDIKWQTKRDNINNHIPEFSDHPDLKEDLVNK